MKARTKSAKIKQKRGRPRMEDVAREPNGRISRSGIPHESADIVAIKARMRQHGITKAQARDPRSATFIGRLSRLGRADGISEDQYEALQRYLDLRAAWHRAIKAPDATLSSEGAGMPNGTITDEYIDWVHRVKESYVECREAIQEAQNESRENLWGALDHCVIRGDEHHHMVPAVRIVGNTLRRFFGT